MFLFLVFARGTDVALRKYLDDLIVLDLITGRWSRPRMQSSQGVRLASSSSSSCYCCFHLFSPLALFFARFPTPLTPHHQPACFPCLPMLSSPKPERSTSAFP